AHLHISDRGGPEADDIGRLTKYAALYAGDGSTLDATPTFTDGAPPYTAVTTHARATPFDLPQEGERLRAIHVIVPNHAGVRLLLAASTSDMEKDTTYLRRALLIGGLAAVALTMIVTWRVVRQLTRGHERIAQTARQVAAGELDARTGLSRGDE